MLDAPRRTALSMLARWMGERFFRTFRSSAGDPGAFDAVLVQRERRVGVSIGVLWDESEYVPGAQALAEMLTADVGEEPPGHVVWVPPGADLPTEEPALSGLRVALAKGMSGLGPGERREVRLPVTLRLAKIQDDGQYVSVSGVLSKEWTRISEGVQGAFHLDARPLHRLPDEPAETDIIISRVRDRAALLNAEEVTDVQVHDYWTVSRLPAVATATAESEAEGEGEAVAPGGVALIAAPLSFDPLDGTMARRLFRYHIARAVEQRQAGECDLSVLVMVAALGHIEDELLTAALRGMNPALYGALDLVALVADGRVRQVLQPRRLPWEAQR